MLPKWKLLLLALPLFLAACYENNLACLDPDATNYDLLGDDVCPDDCCQYPNLSLDIDRFWEENVFVSTDTFTDGAANEFRLLRFRFYLGDILLLAGAETLPVPENLVEVDLIAGTDTVLTEINANVVLVNSSGSTSSTVGRLRTGTSALTQVQATLGLAAQYTAVYPPTAPASSPLATQEGILNFNDGQGYLQASAEYLLTATDDTVRVDVLGNQPLLLDFPTAEVPTRGANVTVEMEADYARVFRQINLAETEIMVATSLANALPDLLVITGVR
ncbi:MAG: MbnP family protein [Bacteroidota bacterium]